MRKYWWLVIATLLLIIVAAGVGGFLLGDVHAVKGISRMRATPHQLAEAMKQDRFFSGSTYGVSCDLGAMPAAPRVGETFTVLTVGQAAERLPAGVLLRDCVVP
jgi:hypothetical protein